MKNKLKIAVDVSPLKNDSRFRGIGFYTKNLLNSFRLYGKDRAEVILVDNNKVPPDCNLIHYPYFDLFKPSLPFLKGKPTVVTIHDVIPLKFPLAYPPGVRGRLNLFRQCLSLLSVKSVICDSESSKKDIIYYLKIPSDKINVIYLAPLPAFKPLPKKSLTEIGEKYDLPGQFVLYVGDANYNKNLPRLVMACRTAGLQLVLVGKKFLDDNIDKNHPENRDLVFVQKAIATSRFIKALGFVEEDDLVGVYNLASVYCQPSLAEGFGLPVTEAMACGTPVATSNCSSLSEIVGMAGALFNPYNVDEMSACLADIIKNKDKRKKLSQAGLVKVRDYNWRRTAIETISIYERSVGSR